MRAPWLGFFIKNIWVHCHAQDTPRLFKPGEEWASSDAAKRTEGSLAAFGAA